MLLSQYPIADGIRLHYHRAEQFKSNELTVSFLLPLEKESAALTTLLPNVLLHATEHYPTLAQLNDHTNDLYGASVSFDTEKKGDLFSLSISVNFLKNEFISDGTDLLSEAISLLEEILYCPLLENGAFCERIVALEKEKAIAAIKSLIDNKRAYAAVRLIDEMCRTERYSIRANGTVEDMEAITPNSLYAHYLTLLERAPIEIFFIGSGDPTVLCARLGALFAKQKREPLSLPSTEIIARAERVNEVREPQQAQQSNLVLGFRGVPSRADLEKSAAFAVFCDLYGGSPTSKLFLNVREKKSLCYFCRASARSQKGLMLVQAGIAAENKSVAQEEILYQLDLTRAGEITDEEILMAKRDITNLFRAISDSPATIQSHALNLCVDGASYSMDEYLAAIAAVTREQIIAAAKNLTLDTVFFLEGIAKEEADV